MSVSLDIRNLKTKADQVKKEREFFRLLKLQQKLNREYDMAVNERAKNEQLGITPVQPVQRTIGEEVQDETFQRQIADKNLRTILRVDEAKKVLSQLQLPDIVLLNNNFKAIEKKLEGETNIQATTFVNFFRRFLTAKASMPGGLDLTKAEVVEQVRPILKEALKPKAPLKPRVKGETLSSKELLKEIKKPGSVARVVPEEDEDEDVPLSELKKRIPRVKKPKGSDFEAKIKELGFQKVKKGDSFSYRVPRGMKTKGGEKTLTGAEQKDMFVMVATEPGGMNWLKKNRSKFSKENQVVIGEVIDELGGARAMGGTGARLGRAPSEPRHQEPFLRNKKKVSKKK